MKKVTGLMAAIVVAGVVNAGDAGVYIAGKTGSMQVDSNYLDDDTPIGVVLGYDFGTGFAAEYEHNSAELDYKYDYGIGVYRGSLDYDTDALYGVWRSGHDIYLKAKAGVIHEDLESDNDTGGSFGAGAGVVLAKNLMLEVEYTFIEQDVNYFSGSIGYHF